MAAASKLFPLSQGHPEVFKPKTLQERRMKIRSQICRIYTLSQKSWISFRYFPITESCHRLLTKGHDAPPADEISIKSKSDTPGCSKIALHFR